MSANDKDKESTWVDPDDAPELTEEWFQRADVYHGDKLISRGKRPDGDSPVSKRNPFEVAKDVMAQKFPGALAAFVAGSFNRREETAYSDIDLVVIYEKLDHAWRESFMAEGWPVEAFVHDPETLRYFIYEVDAKVGVLYLASMLSEGSLLGDIDFGNRIKELAAEALNEKPPRWDEETLAKKRYVITDLIDDLRAPRNEIEAAATIGMLHEELGNFYFRSQGLWSASKKHIPRKLAELYPVLAEHWDKAFLKALRGERAPLIALAENILRPFDGFLFDGYRQDAPIEWRKNSLQ